MCCAPHNTTHHVALKHLMTPLSAVAHEATCHPVILRLLGWRCQQLLYANQPGYGSCWTGRSLEFASCAACSKFMPRPRGLLRHRLSSAPNAPLASSPVWDSKDAPLLRRGHEARLHQESKLSAAKMQPTCMMLQMTMPQGRKACGAIPHSFEILAWHTLCSTEKHPGRTMLAEV